MNKHILKHIVMGIAAFCAVSCQDSESDLLKPKAYFENNLQQVTMPNSGNTLTVDITARISNKVKSAVAVSYSLADPSLVATYNSKYGTNYQTFKSEDAAFVQATSSVETGKLYAEKVSLTLKNLDKLEEGKTYMLPIQLHSSSVPVIAGEDISYILLAKPIKITNAALFYSNYVSVKFPNGTLFKSFTFEALINSMGFGSNNTIMGTEGLMILRVGDTGGGIPSGILQAAGRQHYEAPEKLQPNKWYHLALTFDQPSGKTVMYVNGVKWAESTWNIPSLDFNSDVGFNIGKIPGFQWGERPFYGYMSEIRVWNVARTENQIKQKMLGVNPKSDGLELYFKMNGTEKTSPNTITDAAKGIECRMNGIEIKQLDEPLTMESIH